MAVSQQEITNDYAAYNGDCVEVARDMPENSIDLSVYSPPFSSLFTYSSDARDMSNCYSHDQFYEQYGFLVEQLGRITKQGRMNIVHCMDIPMRKGGESYHDLQGGIIKLHEQNGFKFMGRIMVWREPWLVARTTKLRHLMHQSIVDDASKATVAASDFLLVFKNRGECQEPIKHERGFTRYFGSEKMPEHLIQYRNHEGPQTENRFSQWIWKQYASACWNDIRTSNKIDNGDGYIAKAHVDVDYSLEDEEDEKHLHPTQMDCIHRAVQLWSNERETVFTPFMGVGTEVYSAVYNNRRGIGVELKESYYDQALKNIAKAKEDCMTDQTSDLFT